MLRRLACLIVLLPALTCTLAFAKPFTGPYLPSDALTFYLVNPTGQAIEATVRWRVGSLLLVRGFDPLENLVLRQELSCTPEQAKSWQEARLTLPAAGAGVYQINITVRGRTELDLKTNPELDYGVFGSFQWLTGRGDQFADAYVYLPPKLPKLHIDAFDQLKSLALLDESGQSLLSLDEKTRSGEVDLPATGEHVWRLQAKGPSYRLDFKTSPLILCPNPETARTIHASVDIMPDGTLCFFKYQVAAWKLLQQYKQRPASDYAVTVEPPEQRREAWLKQPDRNRLLWGDYGLFYALPAILAQQCLDPKSPWFGSIWEWKNKDGQPRTDNPLTDYNRLGLDGLARPTKNLAALWWLRADFNPYYHNPQIMNRIVIGELLDMLTLKEGEYCTPDNIYYGGIHAFNVTHNHTGAFSLVYKSVPPEVQKLWHAHQQRLTDRLLFTEVGGCTNQWGILLDGLWRYYEGTGEEAYRQAILRNVHWLTSGQNGVGQVAAGYMTEALGPDATYNGITGHSLSFIYHQSLDPALLEAQRKSYALFNHTIAPEPDGKWLGSSGYCHRTPGDWTSPQYGAGLGPMAKYLSEAGVRFPDHEPWVAPAPAKTPEARKLAEEALLKVLHYAGPDYFARDAANSGRCHGAFDIGFANWRTYTDDPKPGVLPCQETQSFTRNFGDQFFCVKRPGYYAFLFGAQAYQPWQKSARGDDYLHQYPHNDGLCLFWSPSFGASLLTKNWGAPCANTLLVKLPTGQTKWPDYFTVKGVFDTQAATAMLTGQLQDAPLSYQRVYRFLEDRVVCELTITAREAFTAQGLWECLPYPLADIKPGMTVKLLDGQGRDVASPATAKAIYFANAAGQGQLVTVSEPAPLALGQDHTQDHYGGQHDYGRALISLPVAWTAGQSFTLKYTWQPCAADKVTAALVQ